MCGYLGAKVAGQPGHASGLALLATPRLTELGINLNNISVWESKVEISLSSSFHVLSTHPSACHEVICQSMVKLKHIVSPLQDAPLRPIPW